MLAKVRYASPAFDLSSNSCTGGRGGRGVMHIPEIADHLSPSQNVIATEASQRPRQRYAPALINKYSME